MTDSCDPSPPSSDGGHTQVGSSIIRCGCVFDVSIELDDHGDGTILTPFSIPSYDELDASNSDTHDFVKFNLEIEDNKVDSIDFKIAWQNESGIEEIIYSESAAPNLLRVGEHEWKWDGYSDQLILNTKILKAPSLKLTIEAQLCGVTKTDVINFDNEDEEQDWVDIIINKSTQNVAVELRVDIRDGGEDGVGESPPSEVQSELSLADSDPRLQPHVRLRSYIELKNLALDGLRKYWSRDVGNSHFITTNEGNYTVSTNPISTTENSMDDIDVEYNTNSDWGRSSNPGSVRGIISFFANFISEHAVYNAGWIKYNNGWFYVGTSTEDNDFSETAAHEIGHEILSAYGGEVYSYGHRGSSGVISQSPKATSDGGESYPPFPGEIDLMKYYIERNRPSDFFSRVVASEVDVKSLIWLARIEFDD